MKRRSLLRPLGTLLAGLCMLALIFALFLSSLSRAQNASREQGRAALENAIRRSAVACYATEGVYPPDVDYLCRRYGLQLDTDRYTVYYTVFAGNLLPEITVLEK